MAVFLHVFSAQTPYDPARSSLSVLHRTSDREWMKGEGTPWLDEPPWFEVNHRGTVHPRPIMASKPLRTMKLHPPWLETDEPGTQRTTTATAPRGWNVQQADMGATPSPNRHDQTIVQLRRPCGTVVRKPANSEPHRRAGKRQGNATAPRRGPPSLMVCRGALCSAAGHVTGASHELRHSSTQTTQPKKRAAAANHATPRRLVKPSRCRRENRQSSKPPPQARTRWRPVEQQCQMQ